MPYRMSASTAGHSRSSGDLHPLAEIRLGATKARRDVAVRCFAAARRASPAGRRGEDLPRLRYPLAQRGEERSLRRQAIRQSDWRRRSAILGRSAHAARVANTVAGAR